MKTREMGRMDGGFTGICSNGGYLMATDQAEDLNKMYPTEPPTYYTGMWTACTDKTPCRKHAEV